MDLVKFKKDIQNLLIREYNGKSISKEEVNKITKNLKSFPLDRFYDYYMFNIKYMRYVIGFDIGYNLVIFYSDGCCVEGFYQAYPLYDYYHKLNFIEVEKIDLMEKRKKELDNLIKWFKEKYNQLNNGSKSTIDEG